MTPPAYPRVPRDVLRLSAATGLVTAALWLWTSWLAAAGSPGAPPGSLSPIFFTLFTIGDLQALSWALLMVMMAALLAAAGSRAPTAERLTSIPRWVGRHPAHVAVLTAVISCLGSYAVYEHSALSMDEYAAVFQSQVFAAGHLHGQFPVALLDWLVPRGFQGYFFNVSHDDGAVVSAYWPGFALLLTPFTWAGVPWACNPLLTALSVLAVHRVALQLFGEDAAAGWAVLLTIASPVIFANGISAYAMPAHLLANTLFVGLMLSPKPRNAFLAGVVGSVALTLHNPVPHLAFALPWLAWTARRRDALRLCASLAAGYAPLCLLLGLGWALYATNGVPLANVGAAFAWPSHGLWLARAVGLAKLWAWAVPGLVLLSIAGAWAQRSNAGCRLLALSALSTLAVYVFVPFDQGHGWGFRYFHGAWFALPLLAAGWFAARGEAPSASSPALSTFVVSCALMSLTAGVALRAAQMHGFVHRHRAQMPDYRGHERRVVILDTRRAFYGRDLVQNDPWLRGDVIILLTHGAAADAALMHDNFPQFRQVYGDGFGAVWSAAQTRAAAAST